MNEELESMRLEAIRQLEQEQENRAAKLRQLQQAVTELEAADCAATGQMLRAKEPFTDRSKCLRCWVWDGKLVELTLVPSTDDADRFRCRECGHEYEFPA